jgi:uncharacterized protein
MATFGSSTAIDKPTIPPPEHRKHQYRDYGGNPLAHVLSDTGSIRLSAFGGALQPGLYRPPPFKFANPVPLGLSGFALTTFLLSCINLGVCGLNSPALVIGPAMAYGGFVQLLAGMWDIALGNVFGGTALSSYGGFWISIGIILTPGGFRIQDSFSSPADFYAAFGLYIFGKRSKHCLPPMKIPNTDLGKSGWFIYTFILWLCTLKSTLFFSSLFACVWLSFICQGVAYIDAQNNADGQPTVALVRAAGGFGIVAGFLAWYNMLAGIAEPSISFFAIPVIHFPWSEKARNDRKEKRDAEVENGDSV